MRILDDDHGPRDQSSEGWRSWTTEKQKEASDPTRSAWVMANAGSGKTHVLTQRVIRLLLSGARPSAILCLTYTKAAAAEMSNRVFERLARWVTLDEATLAAEIASLEGGAPSRQQLDEARRLFARALETPGGLKIQTIHAFCEALLHQFPLEANVAGHFSVLDDRAAAVLMADARRLLLNAAASRYDPALADAFATVLELADDTGLEKLLSELVAARAEVQAFLARTRAEGGPGLALRRSFALGPEETAETILNDLWPFPTLSGASLDAYIALARSAGGAKAGAFADGLAAAARIEDPLGRLQALKPLFLSASTGKPLADSTFFTAKMSKAAPELESAVLLARDHLLAILDRLNRLHMVEASEAALTLADRLNRDYDALKKSRSQLDFDDLIRRAANLLTRDRVSAWVHYKLDRGIDHVLVDEAQDTSPVQWTIIRALTGDFFSGASARTLNRTLFAVGDEKQSIYSFQGARPEQFAGESEAAARRVQGGGRPFSAIRLQLSFRSTEDVLSAVDAVFAQPSHARGLSARDEPVIHASNRSGQVGLVEVWEPILPAPEPELDDWTAAFDATPEDAPANVLARRIAAVLEAEIGKATVMEKGVARPMRPGDVIVLVRKRDAFVGALTRALKGRRDIPVAGADRLVLTRHIAIQDLVALGRFLLFPEDDLSLAAVLKSPLLNLSEDDLLDLAPRRPVGVCLWEALRALEEDAPKQLLAARQRLENWQAMLGRLCVHDFYARVLAHDGGRAAFLARLGSEVGDVLDEFLTFALDHEKNSLPGLQAFIASLEAEAPTVKREQDKERDEVRIMTVHAAKGLEAPVVFLVDGGGQAFSSQHVPSFRLMRDPAARTGEAAALPVWRAPRSPSNSLVEADMARLKQAAEEEYRRLLYVGMTRAADRLVICGYQGKRANPESWHAMVSSGLSADPAGRAVPASFAAGGMEWQGLRWHAAAPGETLAAPPAAKAEQQVFKPLPDALTKPLPPFPRLPRPLSPSGTGAVIEDQDRSGLLANSIFSRKAPVPSLLRGALLHRFLQVLPGMPEDEREAAGLRYLARAVPHWPEQRQKALIADVLGLTRLPELALLFSPKGRAEVSVMGTLALGSRSVAVSGRIDRIAVEDGVVTLADFKTNRMVPSEAAYIDSVHRAQLALYRAVLRPLYPAHAFRCLLVYTEGPAVFTLDDAVLEEALDALSAEA
ncbi:double-strand break repair helicase AddA [Xaviernesmea oryzae]|uniref:DNA 3'-5' helicase n=1 Tax=Xaviernesmea oryzae TaxID=464029 RepID=A0A1Q9AYG6_9HYPH|nr:double-strand break repair helicase AddA [Xaviernesmea oryzae]OLP60492.1 double-strand break repair helicase AddA [Xaviernesmea oryzae]